MAPSTAESTSQSVSVCELVTNLRPTPASFRSDVVKIEALIAAQLPYLSKHFSIQPNLNAEKVLTLKITLVAPKSHIFLQRLRKLYPDWSLQQISGFTAPSLSPAYTSRPRPPPSRPAPSYLVTVPQCVIPAASFHVSFPPVRLPFKIREVDRKLFQQTSKVRIARPASPRKSPTPKFPKPTKPEAPQISDPRQSRLTDLLKEISDFPSSPESMRPPPRLPAPSAAQQPRSVYFADRPETTPVSRVETYNIGTISSPSESEIDNISDLSDNDAAGTVMENRRLSALLFGRLVDELSDHDEAELPALTPRLPSLSSEEDKSIFIRPAGQGNRLQAETVNISDEEEPRLTSFRPRLPSSSSDEEESILVRPARPAAGRIRMESESSEISDPQDSQLTPLKPVVFSSASESEDSVFIRPTKPLSLVESESSVISDLGDSQLTALKPAVSASLSESEQSVFDRPAEPRSPIESEASEIFDIGFSQLTVTKPVLFSSSEEEEDTVFVRPAKQRIRMESESSEISDIEDSNLTAPKPALSSSASEADDIVFNRPASLRYRVESRAANISKRGDIELTARYAEEDSVFIRPPISSDRLESEISEVTPTSPSGLSEIRAALAESSASEEAAPVVSVGRTKRRPIVIQSSEEEGDDGRSSVFSSVTASASVYSGGASILSARSVRRVQMDEEDEDEEEEPIRVVPPKRKLRGIRLSSSSEASSDL